MATYVTGAGEASYTPVPGRSALGITAEAARAALADAGVGRDEVDGLVTGYTLTEPRPMLADALAEYLALRPAHCVTLNAGGATGTLLVRHAAQVLASGACRRVVVAWGDSRVSGAERDDVLGRLASFSEPQFEAPYGPLIASLYALVAARYLHERGGTPADLAEVAVRFRAHAARNPAALRRAPITVDDVLASRPVATPLRTLDCCLVSDFGAALVLSADPGDGVPVRVLGTGEAHRHEYLSQAEDMLRPGAGASAAAALGQAGLTVGDLDLAELYDSFTITVLLQIEEMGIAPPGGAAEMLRAGRFDLDGGDLPLNTAGGMLSAGGSGLSLVVEAVRQLRGEAEERQVEGARTALVHGIGGVLSSHCTVVLGRD